MFRPLTLFIGFRYLKGRSTDKFSRFVTMMSTAGIGIGVLGTDRRPLSDEWL